MATGIRDLRRQRQDERLEVKYSSSSQTYKSVNGQNEKRESQDFIGSLASQNLSNAHTRSEQNFCSERLLRLKDVLEMVPVGRSTFLAGVKSGRFPAPVRHLGPRITAWKLSEIKQLVNGTWTS